MQLRKANYLAFTLLSLFLSKQEFFFLTVFTILPRSSVVIDYDTATRLCYTFLTIHKSFKGNFRVLK